MGQQPIWKISIPDALDRNSVEELLAEMFPWQEGGTGLQIERIDVAQGLTGLFLSGSEADAQTLVTRIGQHQPKLASRLECTACTAKELYSMERPGAKSRTKRRS